MSFSLEELLVLEFFIVHMADYLNLSDWNCLRRINKQTNKYLSQWLFEHSPTFIIFKRNVLTMYALIMYKINKFISVTEPAAWRTEDINLMNLAVKQIKNKEPNMITACYSDDYDKKRLNVYMETI